MLFSAIQTSGATTIGDFTSDPVRVYNALYKTIRELPKSHQATLIIVLQKLAKSGTNQLISDLFEKLSQLAKKLYD